MASVFPGRGQSAAPIDEWLEKANQIVFLSATPSAFEISRSTQVVEQIIRPTGLIDPEVMIRPTKGQIDDLLHEIRERAIRGSRGFWSPP